MITKRSRFMALASATTFMGSAIAAPIAASASEEGRKNTTLGLGAAAAYLLLTQKNKLPGLIAAGGAVYAYKRYDDAVRARHKRQQSRRIGRSYYRTSRSRSSTGSQYYRGR